MSPLTEAQAERLLEQLQMVAEQAPMELRPKRRAIVRGIRCALDAVAEGLSPDDMRSAMLAELGITYQSGQRTPTPKREPLAPYADPLPLDAAIIELWNAGKSVTAICAELGCTDMVVDRVRKWCSNAAVGIQPDARQRGCVIGRQQANGH
ncbi:hypothetical protein [Pseudomonas putida]